MTLLQLEYVAAVVREGTILAAADKLHVSHPSISKAITALEAELGVRLFVRTNAGTTPTAEGQATAACAEHIQDELNHLRHSLGTQAKTSISLNVFPLDTTPHLMDNIGRIRKQFPHLSIHIHQDTLTNVISSVEAQEYDLGIVVLPLKSLKELSSKLRVHTFRNERLVVACGAQHPLAAQEYVIPKDLRDYSLVLHDDKIIVDILASCSTPITALTYSNNNTLIKQMLQQGNAVSIYTSALEKSDPLVRSGDIRLIPLKDDSLMDDVLQVCFVCISYAKRPLASCEKQFIHLLQTLDNES